jgi:hypothetical protein
MVAARLRRRNDHRRLLLVLLVGVGLLVVAASVVARLTPPPPPPMCRGPACAPAPSAPVPPQLSYRSSAYGFHVGYSDTLPGVGQIAIPTSTPTQLELQYPFDSGTGTITFTARPDRGQTPQQVVESVQAQLLPGATTAYTLWNPMVGYQPGYGAVYDYSPQSGNGTSVHDRVVVVAAVKRGLAVVAVAEGPFVHFSSALGLGHPSAVDTLVAVFFDDPLNSVRWPGDPPR